LKFEFAPDERNVESFQHLVEKTYFDNDTLLEFITTRLVDHCCILSACAGQREDWTRGEVSNPRGRCDPYERVNARLEVNKLAHERGDQELYSATLNT
jgi:hypothetical protein